MAVYIIVSVTHSHTNIKDRCVWYDIDKQRDSTRQKKNTQLIWDYEN